MTTVLRSVKSLPAPPPRVQVGGDRARLHPEAARLGQGVLLAVQQLAGRADPGVSSA